MTEKSHVGMTVCYFCGETKDILLDRRLRNSLPHKAIYDMEPCDKCKAEQAQGITLIRVSDNWDGKGIPESFGWIVVKEDAIDRIFNPDVAPNIHKARKAFLDTESWTKLGLPT